MGIMSLVEDSPTFRTGDVLSATLLNTIRQNLLALDEVSRLGRGAFSANFGEPPENNDQNPVTIWRGGFRFLTGVTTLTIVTNSSGVQTGDTLRVTRDGATNNDFTLANGAQTHTVTISGAGYTDGQVVEVTINLRHATPGERNWGNTEIRDAYISPIGLSDAYTAPSTFGVISAANLNALSNAVDWLIRRVGQRHEPLFQASVRRPGPFRADGASQTTVRWAGSLVKTAGHDLITALVAVQQKAGGRTETVRLLVNGAQQDSYSVPSTPGESSDTLVYDASAVADGTLLWIEIDMVKSAPSEDAPDTSRLSIYRVASEPNAGTPVDIPALGIRSSYTFGPSGTPGTLLAILNACVTACGTVKARLDANPEIWARQPLYRARYGIDDYQVRVFEPWAIATSMRRIGEALILRGKGLTIGYGPGSFKEGREAFNEVGAQLVENYRTFSAIDGDAVETLLLYLDTVEGLYAGAPFNVRGEDLRYAAEVLKITGAG